MRAVLWVFISVLVIYGIVYLFKDNIRNWFFPNIIVVQTYEQADLQKVRIDWTVENSGDTITVFDKTKQQTEDFRSTGFNKFLFYYNEKLIDEFEQFKTSPSSGHHYRFIIWKRQDSVKLDLQITGPEAPL